MSDNLADFRQWQYIYHISFANQFCVFNSKKHMTWFKTIWFYFILPCSMQNEIINSVVDLKGVRVVCLTPIPTAPRNQIISVAWGNYAKSGKMLKGGPRGRAVESVVSFNHSIISPLCLVWVRAPHWPHVRQAKFYLRVFQMVTSSRNPRSVPLWGGVIDDTKEF